MTFADRLFQGRRFHRGGLDGRTRIGLIGVVVTALIIVVALQTDRLPLVSTGSTYAAYFDDAGGLKQGDNVIVAGVVVGDIRSISLAHTDTGTKAKVMFAMHDDVVIGRDSQGAIASETVLGRRNLTVTPHGDVRLRPGDSIPSVHTRAPYSLIDALDDTTNTIDKTNTGDLNKALTTLSQTFSNTPTQVRAAVDGVAALSKSIGDRDESLRELLSRAKTVTDVVGKRSKQINTLLVDANALLGELQNRRTALGQLIVGVKDVSAQVSGFIADNNAQLKPVLDKLNRVLTIFQDEDGNIRETLDRLGPYANELGEAVASGPFFSSFVGFNTFGDYTQLFINLLQQKYPEALRALLYTNPIPTPGQNVYTTPGPEKDPSKQVAPLPNLAPVVPR